MCKDVKNDIILAQSHIANRILKLLAFLFMNCERLFTLVGSSSQHRTLGFTKMCAVTDAENFDMLHINYEHTHCGCYCSSI